MRLIAPVMMDRWRLDQLGPSDRAARTSNVEVLAQYRQCLRRNRVVEFRNADSLGPATPSYGVVPR